MRILALLILYLFMNFGVMASPGAADVFPGSRSADFRGAMDAWLDGEDLMALKALARLSRDGNPAAQTLLASIASRGSLHGHVTSAMPRKDRVELLRIPKGLSGTSWLTEAQKTLPLAAALLQSAKVGEKAAAIAALVELGEPSTALLAAASMLSQGESDQLIEVLQGLDNQLPQEAAPLLAWAVYQQKNRISGRYVGSARVGSLILKNSGFRADELVWVPPWPRDLVEDPSLRAEVLNLVDDVRFWTPIRSFCSVHCDTSYKACTMIGASLSSAGPFAMRSPLESLISNEDYWTSPRVEADLARQTRNVSDWKNWAKFRELNECFFQSMEKSQGKFGHAD